jgi:hypothetical protein
MDGILRLKLVKARVVAMAQVLPDEVMYDHIWPWACGRTYPGKTEMTIPNVESNTEHTGALLEFSRSAEFIPQERANGRRGGDFARGRPTYVPAG